ncbi:sugar ABC transporter permease, partial [Sesbania bispinosa]
AYCVSPFTFTSLNPICIFKLTCMELFLVQPVPGLGWGDTTKLLGQPRLRSIAWDQSIMTPIWIGHLLC